MTYHPSVWITPIKEIHYFDKPSPLPMITKFFDPKRNKRKRLLYEAKRPLYNLKKRTGKYSFSSKMQSFLWTLRFFMLPCNDKWYASLFSPGLGQIAGDITPGYAVLGEETVCRIHDLMPDAKIIYLLRNPIHRTWSQASMFFISQPGCYVLERLDDERIKIFLSKEDPVRHSEYLKNLQTWEKFYPQHQIFVGFFEQLDESPAGFLRDIYDFLGLDSSDRFIPLTVNQKQNARQYPPMPDYVAYELARRYYDQIEQLHRRFANQYTSEWLESAKQHL